MISEVSADLKKIKKNKSPGIDDIPTELLKPTGESGEKIFSNCATNQSCHLAVLTAKFLHSGRFLKLLAVKIDLAETAKVGRILAAC